MDVKFLVKSNEICPIKLLKDKENEQEEEESK